jgi:hypothetical protein
MRLLPIVMALGVACTLVAPALAQTAVGAVAPATTPTPKPKPLSEAALGAESGQGVTNTVMSEQQLSATNSGNSIVATVMRNGDVAFSTGALSGFTGIGNFVINTGNNSNLQGTISVNIVTNAPPL